MIITGSVSLNHLTAQMLVFYIGKSLVRQNMKTSLLFSSFNQNFLFLMGFSSSQIIFKKA